MKRLTTFVLLIFCLSTKAFSQKIDSAMTLRLEKLAFKMRLKTPKLIEGEYEIRIWNTLALRYGDAHALYVLTKTANQFTVSKYVIDSDQRGFRHAIQLKPNPSIPINDTLWEQLVQQDLLTLPSATLIHDQLYPKPPKDSTWTVVEADGSVSVKAKRRDQGWVIIGDGEGYYFEVFSAGNYRACNYSNPRGYLSYKPSTELRKVVTILDKLTVLFRSSN